MAKFLVTIRHKNSRTTTKEIFAGCKEGATNKAYESYGYKPNSKVKDILVTDVKKISYE